MYTQSLKCHSSTKGVTLEGSMKKGMFLPLDSTLGGEKKLSTPRQVIHRFDYTNRNTKPKCTFIRTNESCVLRLCIASRVAKKVRICSYRMDR